MNQRILRALLLFSIASFLIGCSSIPKSDRGPDGTIAYYIDIESSEPGARVEANEEFIGHTPVRLKIFGDRDGTFHNFGSSDYVIRAFPSSTNQFPQTKLFRTGGWFSQEDRIPSRIYFDLNQKTSTFTLPRY